MPLLPPSEHFPPAEDADPEGLVGFGGELSPEWLLDAYRHGIFPWPITDFEAPLAWWSPDPRAMIEFERFHVSRRLRRTCRSGRVRGHAGRRFRRRDPRLRHGAGRLGQTWLTPEMIEAYIRLHELGHAHSVEVWYQQELAGGVYGVAIGGLFAAESKFYRVRDASKVALVQSGRASCGQRGYALLDIQQLTPHTARFGADGHSAGEYLARLAEAIEMPVRF